MKGDEDIKFMRRCLDLAVRAEGRTYPNPLVGSVIVHNGKIAGEGYHRRPGEPHAERIAINCVKDRDLLKASTLYVNLEPCSHHGRTPPCSDLIIESGIKKVILGTMDTSDKVSGKGIAALRNAGCEVVTGVMENECRWINRRFFTFHEKKRPYIILKWAQSSDGFMDIDRGNYPGTRPVWISGETDRVLVHKWRAEEQSILVGAATIRADNPMLNVREWAGSDPLKLILSKSGNLDVDAAVFRSGAEVIVFTQNDGTLAGYNGKIRLDRNRSSAPQLMEYLFKSGIESLFIEGGATVLNHFISEDLWDEARIFTGKLIFGSGIKAPVVKGDIKYERDFSRSHLSVVVNATD